MLLLVLLVGAIAKDYVEGASTAKGTITTSTKAIDLKFSIKVYTVNCTLNFKNTNNNIRFLRILENGSQLDTEILSDITISYTAHLNESHITCGEKRYTCEYFGAKIDEQVVTLGEPPSTIDPAKFRCISENLNYLQCHFPVDKNRCQFGTSHSLLVISADSFESCKLTKVNDLFRFDSRDQSCQYPADEEVIEFRLRTTNLFGSVTQKILVDHYDVVRPAAPHNVDLQFSKEEKQWFLSWKSKRNLNYFGRKFEYNIRCKNESSFESTSMVFRGTLGKTITCRHPTVRLRVIPENSNQNQIWSDWGKYVPYWKGSTGRSGHGTKLLDESNEERVTAVFNYIENYHQSMTIEVFWQRDSTSSESNLVAVSESGVQYQPSWNNIQPAIGRAIFYNLKHEKHNITLDENLPEAFQVQPIIASYQPRFKKLLNNNKSFEVSWFPPDNQDDLQSYTVMYCHLTATSVCEESVVFQRLPPTDTAFNIYSEKTLNFAVSAEYPNYTSSLVWQQCIVSPSSNTHNKSPKFHFFDVSCNSAKLRLETSCEDRSLYERLVVHVIDSSKRKLVKTESYKPHESVVNISDLEADTVYEVQVVGYNASNIPHESRLSVITKKTASDDRLSIYIVTGLVLLIAMISSAYRVTVRIRAIMNIEVEFPFGLLGIDEEPVKICVENEGFQSDAEGGNYLVKELKQTDLEVIQEEDIGADFACGRCGVTPSKLIEFEENIQQQDIGYLSVEVIKRRGI